MRQISPDYGRRNSCPDGDSIQYHNLKRPAPDAFMCGERAELWPFNNNANGG